MAYGPNNARAIFPSWSGKRQPFPAPVPETVVVEKHSRKNTSKSYIWVFRGGPVEKPVVMFHYEPSRSVQVARDFLDGYHGYVQTDGYQGYNILADNKDITLLSCMAHARRKFDEVVKGNRKSGNKKTLAAERALEYIRQLYAIEKEAKNMTPDERYLARQEKAKPNFFDEVDHEWMMKFLQH